MVLSTLGHKMDNESLLGGSPKGKGGFSSFIRENKRPLGIITVIAALIAVIIVIVVIVLFSLRDGGNNGIDYEW